MHPIDCLVLKGRHYIDHVAPVWKALPRELQGRFLVSPDLRDHAAKLGIEAEPIHKQHIRNELVKGKGMVLLVGHSDSEWTDKAGRDSIIMMHGVGFNFDDKKSLPSYPGTTRNRERVRLMLSTNEHIAEIERVANPHIPVEVIGCPKLDKWHNRPKKERSKKPVVALAFHWRCRVAPEAGTAFDVYKNALSELTTKYDVIGHCHPLIAAELAPIYAKLGIEYVADLEEVFERADLLVADATSAQYEWATLDRPQVVLNIPAYRRNIDFGLRFWKHADVGIQCDKPADLMDAVATALRDTKAQQKARHAAVEYAYAYTDGECTERAVTAILGAMEAQPTEPVKPKPAPVTRTVHARRSVMGTTRRSRLTPSEREERRLAIIRNPAHVRLYGGGQSEPIDYADRDAWLTSMGWRIPKEQMELSDPDVWPSVAIIVPVYNSPKLLKRCINSLRKTQYPSDRGIFLQIVDNASTDKETLRLIKGWNGNLTNSIRFDSPVGFSEAVNAGLKRVQDFDYHVLFNQDVDAIDPQWLKHLIRFMESKPECGICGPKLLYDDGTIENAGIDMAPGDGCAERGRHMPVDDPRFNDYRKVATVSGAVYCMRSSIEKDMGLFDERYKWGCEDLEYGMRLTASTGMECWYVPDSVLVHSSHGVQRDSNLKDKHRIREMHKVSSEIYEREWGPYYNHLGKQTRIAFILPNFHSACGGARVVGALARQLSLCGARAEVFVRKMDSDPDTEFPHFSIRPLRELTETDIVIATRFDTVADARRVKAKKRYYLVQQIEDVMAHNCGGTKRQALESYQDRDFEIITIGQHLADRLKDMGRDSHILDVGFYRSMYPYTPHGRSEGNLRVLMYGVGGYKGPDQAAIVDAIRRTVPGVEINSFHRYAELPKWSDNHFRPQTTAEVAELYASHDVYVYASESDGFAMTPIEAMACGTPVVLTDFPGKDQYAEHEGNCLIAGFRAVDMVASLVRRLADEPDTWNRLQAAGLETAERYDWGKVGAQYARLLLEAHT